MLTLASGVFGLQMGPHYAFVIGGMMLTRDPLRVSGDLVGVLLDRSLFEWRVVRIYLLFEN